MADAAEQFDDQSGDSEFRIAVDLARERAKARRQNIEITEITRDYEVANDNGQRGAAVHVRPPAGAVPSGDSFLNDMRAPAPANDNALPGAASPAFVAPQNAASPVADEGPEPDNGDGEQGADDADLDDGEYVAKKNYRSPRPNLEDESFGGGQSPAEQLSKAPEASTVPLVGEQGAPVGLAAAYAGENYQGGQSGAPGSLPAGVVPEEGEEGAPVEGQDQTGARPSMGRMGDFSNAPEVRQLEQQFKKREEDQKDLDRRINGYKRKHIRPLQIAVLGATWADTVSIIGEYEAAVLGLTAGLWWILLIGIIIDFCVVIPFLFVVCFSGAYKGPLRAKLEEQLKQKKAVLKKMESERRRIEQDMLSLRRQQFEVMQSYAAQARNEQRPGRPPTVGGIPLAT